MARSKLSEFRAKTMLLQALGRDYEGVSIDTAQPLGPQLKPLTDGRYVVKVDQGIKKRMKQGLVILDRTKAQVTAAVQALSAKGFRYVLIEPFHPHEQSTERYLAFAYGRDGTTISFSSRGGIDIEEQAAAVGHTAVTPAGLKKVAQTLGVSEDFLAATAQVFEASYACFLEINPLVVEKGEAVLLDVAAEVDNEAAPLARSYWSPEDFRTYRQQTAEEAAIAELAAKSRASLRFEIINPDGALFMLLSGGGASIVVADEVNNRGHGALLGNYGEYSGNPSAAETEIYAHNLLTALLASKARRKALIIAGAVANFTDVRATFTGIIKALDEVKTKLQRQHIKIFVRRGGPHEAEGLAMMRDYLEQNQLLGEVHGPELPLSESVTAALASLKEQA